MLCVHIVVKVAKMKKSMIVRSYSELRHLNTFIDRYNYLRLKDQVGRSTFGYDRYLNQTLYRSRRWSQVRDKVIIRDEGCDLGIEGYEIHSHIVVHHMNPITLEDIEDVNDIVFDPEFLICTTSETHLAIHYGDEDLLAKPPIIRRHGDTTPWR
jgi:hypothetical protein